MDVSIIIVNYNTYNLLKECIESILSKTEIIIYEIIVVDNNSPNRDIENLTFDFPKVKLIKNETNVGFGKANNIGSAHAKGNYLFFLNPDTILLNNSLLYFYEFYSKNQVKLSIGALGSILLDRENQINSSFSMEFGNFPKDIFYSFLRIFNLMKTQDKNVIINDYKKVCWCSGANIFINKDTYKSISGFDEKIFMYFEDEDIQRRLINKGFNNYVIQGPQIIHLEGGGVNYLSLNKKKVIDKSKFYYFKKYSNNLLIYSISKFLYSILTLINNIRSYGIRNSLIYFKEINKL